MASQFTGRFGSSTPSSKIEIKENSLAENQAKKGGAKVGHKGNGRKLFNKAEADETIRLNLEIDKCPQCGGKLESNGIDERCIIDSFLTEARKIIYECQLKKCKCCSKEVSKRPLVMAGSKYGNGLISNALVMHYLEGIPLNKVVTIFGNGVNKGALLHIFHKLAKYWEPALEKLQEEYRQAAVKHADETSWRNDGQNGYSWLFCNCEISLFRFEKTRSSEIPLDVMGDQPLPGVLCVDRYGGYNKVPCHIQYCYAHLLRDVQDLEKKYPKNKEIKKYVGSMASLLAEAMGLRGKEISDEDYYKRAEELKSQILLCSRYPSHHLSIPKYQDIFLDNEHRLFHWVTNRKIPPDNNRAERELRPTVIARKMSFGSQSPRGAKTRSTLMSVFHTAAKRLTDQSIRQWIQSTLETLANNPEIELYQLLPKP